METLEAMKIIQALANGADPFTGEVLPDTSPYNDPSVIRALFLSIKGLEKLSDRAKRDRNTPNNAGKPWNKDEDRQLIEAFDAAVPIRQIAVKHGRTEGSIASRLVRLGKITDRSDVYTRPPRGDSHGKAVL